MSTDAHSSAGLETPKRGLDADLLAAVSVLIAGGLMAIAGATYDRPDQAWYAYVGRQVAGLTGGAFVGLLWYMLPPRFAEDWLRGGSRPASIFKMPVWWFYGFCLALMLYAAFFSRSINGATRWISLGVINLQPSEVMKVAITFALAHILGNNPGKAAYLNVFLMGLGVVGVPALVAVGFQSDLGAAFVFGVMGLTALYVVGARRLWLGFTIGLGGGAFGLFVLMSPYRMARFFSFLHPFDEFQKGSYQNVLALISFALGGVLGKGWMSAGTSALPEAHTDMIAASFVEDFGLVGWVLLLIAEAYLVYTCFRIAYAMVSLYGVLIGQLVGTMFTLQALINLAVVVGLAPNKGLVLPFMSYGPTAAFVDMLMIAVLLRAYRNDALPSVAVGRGTGRSTASLYDGGS